MSTSIVELTLPLQRRFEGFRSSPYLCPAGVPTIGYGSTHYEDGIAVTLKDPQITRERAEQLLRHEVRVRCIPAVANLCPQVHAELAAALVDFVYNLGPGRLRSSTLRKKIQAGELEAVPAELRKWVYGGGRRLTGLVIRREAEILLAGL